MAAPSDKEAPPGKEALPGKEAPPDKGASPGKGAPPGKDASPGEGAPDKCPAGKGKPRRRIEWPPSLPIPAPLDFPDFGLVGTSEESKEAQLRSEAIMEEVLADLRVQRLANAPHVSALAVLGKDKHEAHRWLYSEQDRAFIPPEVAAHLPEYRVHRIAEVVRYRREDYYYSHKAFVTECQAVQVEQCAEEWKQAVEEMERSLEETKLELKRKQRHLEEAKADNREARDLLFETQRECNDIISQPVETEEELRQDKEELEELTAAFTEIRKGVASAYFSELEQAEREKAARSSPTGEEQRRAL
eukprot:TRINITY_DN47612_c0_g1_i1.p1 TRINITY_DN47612_c0_g1~~TRINITY_DN47612_c0_g1_i1.p1  ORF type:complete len:328 (+),score=98.38 TRINITY_DN47612_c0_g1_i1:77-985(+)